jgi:hypothetical protein
VFEDIYAACRLAVREFRNRRFLRRLRAHINDPFS